MILTVHLISTYSITTSLMHYSLTSAYLPPRVHVLSLLESNIFDCVGSNLVTEKNTLPVYSNRLTLTSCSTLFYQLGHQENPDCFRFSVHSSTCMILQLLNCFLQFLLVFFSNCLLLAHGAYRWTCLPIDNTPACILITSCQQSPANIW